MKWNSGSAAAAAAAGGIGAAALTTTIAGRDAGGTIEFLVVGASIRRMAAAAGLAVLLILLLHGFIARLAGGDSTSGRYLRRLIWCAMPAAGVTAAMVGGRFAPPLVYAFWETAPVWMSIAILLSLAEGLRWRPAAWPAPRGAHAVAVAALVVWILAGNLSLRSQFSPVGDEPRYLRHAESWYQGRGADISQIARMAEGPLHEPPQFARSLGLAARALASDSASLAGDMAASVTRRDFVWNRAQPGDGAFLVGRDGGVYQTYQPGLSLLIAPGYAVDRWTATATVFDGQFPDRMYLVSATLLVLVALTLPRLTDLCRQAGAIGVLALAVATLALASLPISSLALQVYPETAACLAIVSAAASLASPTPPARLRAVCTGAATGFLLLLHVRFLVVSAVLLGWGLYRLRGRAAVAFAAGWAGVAVLQIWYAYHATGLPWPTAFYEASGIAPLGPGAVAINMLRFAIDRDWGILPHAPVFILAAAGWVPLWRARRDLAIVVALLALALTATAAAHTVSAAGGTPDRLVAAIVPLLVVPVAAACAAWRDRPLFWIAFLLLAALSLVQAWDYNRSHVKEVGLLMAAGVSGWRINLLFPYLSEGFTAGAARAAAGIAGAIAILTIALVRSSPGTLRGFARAAGATAIVVMVLMTTAGAWSSSHPRYRAREEAQREPLVAAYVRAGSCALCWSSLRGPISPADLGPNAIDRVVLDAEPAAGNVARFRVTASGPNGPVFGVVRFDFADGQVSQPRAMSGALEVSHAYRAAGEYAVKAWLERPGEPRQVVTARVKVGLLKE